MKPNLFVSKLIINCNSVSFLCLVFLKLPFKMQTLNKLSRFNNLPDNNILVTLDVTALYSNIPHNDGIGACKKHLDRRALSTTSSEDICQLIKSILENNVFIFNDEYFLQVCGTAMGTRMAPCYANIFMADLEENFLSGYPYKPLAYYRYIDDIFIIRSHGFW